MFNEANICNILETILFGSSACEALDDSVIDLVDYVLRHLTQLCSGDIKPYSAASGGCSNLKEDLEHWRPGDKLPDVPIESLEEELNRLQEEVTFQVGTYIIIIIISPMYLVPSRLHSALGRRFI